MEASLRQNNNIVYCICSYQDKDIQNMFINTVIKDYKKYFTNLNIAVDFEIITSIPEIINERIDDIHQYYIKKNITEKYSNWLKKEQSKHILKAWNTKFYIIEDFFKSNYKHMMYLDCDLILKKPKQKNPFNSDALCFTTKTRLDKKNEHIIITEKYIPNITINRYVQAGGFCINKDHCFNLKEILNLNKIYSLWETNSFFLREEVTLTYLFYKNNLINNIGKNIRYKHIGNWKTKINYLNESKT